MKTFEDYMKEFGEYKIDIEVVHGSPMYELTWYCYMSINQLLKYLEVFGDLTPQEMGNNIAIIREIIEYMKTEFSEEEVAEQINKIKRCFDTCIDSEPSIRSTERTDQEIDKYLEWEHKMEEEFEFGFIASKLADVINPS